MTTAAATRNRVHGVDHLVGECTTCGLVLEQVDGFDPDVARGTFLHHHPDSPQAVHQPDVPAGWSVRHPSEDS
jgi:hypothetical protein